MIRCRLRHLIFYIFFYMEPEILFFFLTRYTLQKYFGVGKSKRTLIASAYFLRDVIALYSVSLSGSSRLLLVGMDSRVWRFTLSPTAPDGLAP